MRASIILSILLVSACSSQGLKCDRHLTPINPHQGRLTEPAAAATQRKVAQPASLTSAQAPTKGKKAPAAGASGGGSP